MDEKTNSRLLRTIIYPVIWMIWLIHQSEVIKEALVSEFNVYKNYSYSLKELQTGGSAINIAGDGRYDSPGFSAAFCTYFTMVCSI